MGRPLLATRWFQHGLICIAVSLCAHFAIVLAMSWRYFPLQSDVRGESIVLEVQLSKEEIAIELPDELVLAQSPPVTVVTVAAVSPPSKPVVADRSIEPPTTEHTAAAPVIQESAAPDPKIIAINASTPTPASTNKSELRSNSAAETTGEDRPTVERISLIDVMAAVRSPAEDSEDPKATVNLASFAIPDDQPKRGSAPKQPWTRAEKPIEDEPLGAEPQAEFFGVQANGDRFAFVVDCSISMGGDKWIQARRELIGSLKRLNEHQYFYVVFFDGNAHPMPLFAEGKQEAGMMAASAENVDQFLEWLRTVQLGADTRPYRSIRHAMEREPDALFFLSDGAFADPTLSYLRDSNQLDDGSVKSPVHAISFERGRGAALLKRMADENAGEFRIVGRR